MRVCVFVDGENFRYNIINLVDEFEERDYLPQSASWANFFDFLVCESFGGDAVRLRTYWYVIGAVDAWPSFVPTEWQENKHPNKLDEWYEKYQRHIRDHMNGLTAVAVSAELRRRKKRTQDRFAGFHNLQRNIANKHRSVEFKYSGAISHNLFTDKLGREKTVDVNLAVDMLQMCDSYDAAVIVSGDQDYLPAVQAVKNAGKTVVNVAFSARSGKLMPGGAKRLNDSTDWSLIVDQKMLAKYMKLSEKSAT